MSWQRAWHRVHENLPAKLALAVQPTSIAGSFGVGILVSDHDPLGPLRLIGLDPDDLLGALPRLLPDVSGATREVEIGRCGDCGYSGCDSLSVAITREGSSVVWSKP